MGELSDFITDNNNIGEKKKEDHKTLLKDYSEGLDSFESEVKSWLNNVANISISDNVIKDNEHGNYSVKDMIIPLPSKKVKIYCSANGLYTTGDGIGSLKIYAKSDSVYENCGESSLLIYKNDKKAWFVKNKEKGEWEQINEAIFTSLIKKAIG